MPSTARTHQLQQSLIYHIFNRGHNRSIVFQTSDDFKYFIDLLTDYSRASNMQIHHWVVMSNHYHLAVEFAVPAKVSSIMAGIARSYVYYHHRTYKTAGCIWQGRFKSQPIQKELYLNACGRYIERNPVKAGMVEVAWEYPYSSAAYYALGKQDCVTVQSPLFEGFGIGEESRRQKYQEFLFDFDSEEDTLFDNMEYSRGSAEFRRRIIKENGRYIPRRQGRIRTMIA